MAPELPKGRKPRENQYLFDLGTRGRKTGLTLPDTGIRDEHGMEPMDHLFSSPAKSTRKANGANGRANSTLSSDEMDIGDSTVPEPTAVISARAGMRMPPPKSKSPRKTFLNSPARRNPSLGPASSPIRGAVAGARASQTTASVRRILFENDSSDGAHDPANVNRSTQKRAAGLLSKTTPKLLSAPHIPLYSSDHENDAEDAPQSPILDDAAMYDSEDSMQMIDAGDDEGNLEDEALEEERQEEPEEELAAESEEEVQVTAPAKKRGRKRKETHLDQDAEDKPPTKRTRRSLNDPSPDGGPIPQPAAKRGRQAKPKATTGAASKTKATAKKQKLALISEAESPEIQRGPPLPRNNRGLIILRRETPNDATGFQTTRSGRNSIKPVAYWKNERIEFYGDEAEDGARGKIILPRIKEVLRADEPEVYQRKKSYYKPSKGKKRQIPGTESEDEDEAEPWETEQGRIVGDVRQWDPENETGEIEEREDEIALSSAAIITRDVEKANFKFAKTLTLPFFGSGMVDLPPGAIKKPKNSRKMQMVFFVFNGRVEVSVNDSVFRIGKGGMWQVPRNNFYSISNDYDKPARIFFAQGCEIPMEYPDSQ